MGEEAPEWTLEVDGATISSTELEGSVVVLAFFASWCGPCRAEMPELDSLAGVLLSEQAPVVVLGVSTDVSQEDFGEYIEELRPEHLGTGRNPEMAAAFGVRAIPHTFIISPSGTVLAMHNGFSGDTRAIEKDIRDGIENAGR